MEENFSNEEIAEVTEEIGVPTAIKSKKKLIAILSVAGAVLLAAVAALLWALGVFDSVGKDAYPSKLYWNIDGEDFVNDSASGLTSRRKIKGFFNVRFFVDGKIEEYQVTDPRLMIKIDRHYLMGLVFNEEGVITDILDVEDVCGGEIASYFYVMKVEGNQITANSMDSGIGIEQKFEINANTKIYDVSHVDEAFGQVCKSLQEYDRIRVILDSKGRVDTVYVIKREMLPGYCEHCEGEALWREWSDPLRLPETEGHWRLMNDVQLTDRQAVVNSANSVVLDLNGKTVRNLFGKRLYALFYEDAYLAILDSSQEQTGKLVIDGSYNGQGMLVWIRYGEFNLYGGTLDGSNGTSTGNGVAVATSANTIFNMYGGTIIGGIAETVPNDKGGYTQPAGGSVFVAKDSIFNMYGGTIRDGYAKRCLDENGANKGGVGGNVYIASGGTFNMYGGEILDGKAEGLAGNIGMGGKNAVFNMYDGVVSGGRLMYENRNSGNLHVAGDAFFNMYGGTIKDGMATAAGGNVTMYGTMTMSGGLITGGKIMTGAMDALVEKEADNANLHCRNGDFIMTGGHIEGYARVQNADNDGDGVLDPHIFQVSGNSKIFGGTLNLTLMGDMVMDLGELTEGAEIRLSSGGFVSGETVETNLEYIHFDEDLVDGMMVENRVFFGKYQCLCGGKNGHIGNCNGEKLEWKPLTGNTLPTMSGNYYLIRDMENATQSVLSKDAVISFDLNGCTLTMGKNPGAAVEGGTNNYYRAFVLDKDNTVLNICDSVGGGKIVAGVRGDAGLIVNIQAKATVNLYGGTLDGTSIKETTSTGMSGFVNVAKGGRFNMYSGQMLGMGQVSRMNKTTNQKIETIKTNGAAVSVAKDGSFYLYGGTITGGKAHKGGSVYVAGKFVMNGGTVTGGSAREGGNLYVTGGSLTLKGGTVKGGKAETYGGNLYINGGCNGTISGGAVYGGKAETDGANVFVGGNTNSETKKPGSVTVTGGTIYGHFTTSGNTVALGDKVQILDADKNANAVPGLILTGGAKVTLNALSEKAVIKVDTVAKVFAELAEGAEATVNGQLALGSLSAKENPQAVLTIQDSKVSFESLRYRCLCGQETHIGECDGTELLWQLWKGNALPTQSGNYYLDSDITAAGQAVISTQVTINLDLNGHTVTMSPNPGAQTETGSYNYWRAYVLMDDAGAGISGAGSVLSITDTVGGGRIVSGVRSDGGAVIRLQTDATVNLYGGILDGSTMTQTTSNGAYGIVEIHAGKFNMYGGQIIGAGDVLRYEKGSADKLAADTKVTMRGGAVRLCGGSFNMYGGTITGSNASYGGAVFVENGAAFHMLAHDKCKAPVISGGNASEGGNVYVTGSAFTMAAGSVYGGTANNYGGNIYINQSSHFAMTGGEIYGGTASINGNNLFVGGNAGGSAALTGGTVYGGFATTGNTVSVGGSLKVLDTDKDGTDTAYGLKAVDSSRVTVLALESDADIRVDGSVGKTFAVFAEGAEATYSNQFSIAKSSLIPDVELKIAAQNGTLCIADGRSACVCGGKAEGMAGHTCTDVAGWSDWGDTDAERKNFPDTAGSYRLVADIHVQSQKTITSGVVNLDLNGHTITIGQNSGAQTATGSWNYFRGVILAGGTLNITDSVGGGKIVSGVRQDSGSIIRIWNSNASATAGTLNLFGGTLDGSNTTETTGNSISGPVEITNNGVFNMYGGTVIGVDGVTKYGKGPNGTAQGLVTVNGGAVFVNNGTFRMYGGEIYGGKDADGTSDNIHVAANGVAKLVGGTVYGGIYTANNSLSAGGTAQILGKDKNNNAVNGLTLASGKYITLLSGEEALQEKAKLCISSTGKIAVNVSEADKERFEILTVGYVLSLENGELSIVAAP